MNEQNETKKNIDPPVRRSPEKELECVVGLATMLADPASQELTKKSALVVAVMPYAIDIGLGLEDTAKLAIKFCDAEKEYGSVGNGLYDHMEGLLKAVQAMGLEPVMAMSGPALLDEAAFRVDGVRRRPRNNGKEQCHGQTNRNTC